MSDLSGSARKYLRGLAHTLRPVIRVGKEGLTEAVLRATDEALDSHELIKVQFLALKEQRREIAADIARRLACECVGLIGHVAIVYRAHRDPDRRRISLPET